jgi:uncharacterized membrane protein YdjX (TVP38/TMEM64 family)
VGEEPEAQSDVIHESSVSFSRSYPSVIVTKRLFLLLVLIGVGVGIYATGIHEQVTVEAVRELVDDAGLLGPVVFVLLFSLEGLGVPGMIFMLTAIIVWPPWLAFLMNWLGAIAAGTVGFGYARYMGRDWVAAHLPERIRRFETAINQRSIRTVIVIRLLFFLAPPAHWALGLSPVSFRDFMIGSAVGFIPAMLLVSLIGAPVFEWVRKDSDAIWIVGTAGLLLGALGLWAARRYIDGHGRTPDRPLE